MTLSGPTSAWRICYSQDREAPVARFQGLFQDSANRAAIPTDHLRVPRQPSIRILTARTSQLSVSRFRDRFTSFSISLK